MGMVGKASRKALKAVGLISKIGTSKEDADLLERIRKHVQLDLDATEAQRALESDDRRFMDPTTQWDERDRKDREDAGRPCLTEDNIGPFWRQVTNEQRKNKPGVQINPVDSNADLETAEVIQGLIRHIEYNSNADTAYDTAFGWAAGPGRGFYRLTTDYVDSESFEQEILIKRVPDPWFVFVDPAAQEADFSDMKWGGFKAWVSKEDFKAQYPNAELSKASMTEWLGVGDDAPDWMKEDASALMVVEYYYKEFKKITVKKDGQEREGLEIQVKWVKCTAAEILERRDIPGQYIPIVAVLGTEMIQDGQRTWAGLIRAAKHPQQRLNYMLTSQVERIAFMPLATWLGPKGFMGKNKGVWQNAHKNQMAALEFEIIGDDGQGINAPRLITEEAPIVAVTNALEGSKMGLKSVLGMYDANLGNRQGGESGIAIQRLQTQGETGTYHLQDNLARAIRYEGRIILSWLKTYYDTPRIVRIIGEDGTQAQTKVNEPIAEGDAMLKPESVGKTYDLTIGVYDVTISAGPSYQSKRQEDRAMLLGMLTSPLGEIIAQRAGDLVAKTLDSPIAKELADRLMPPDVKQQQDSKGPQIPPQLQQQIQAMAQQHDAMTQEIHRLMDQIELNKHDHEFEMAKAQLDSQTKVAIAEMNNQTALLQTQAQIDAQAADDAIKTKIQELEQGKAELEEAFMAMHGAIAPMMQPGQPEPAEPIVPPTPMPPASAPMGASNPPAITAGDQPPIAGPDAGME